MSEKPSPEELEKMQKAALDREARKAKCSAFLHTPLQKKQITLARSIDRAQRIAEENAQIELEDKKRKQTVFNELKLRTIANFYKSKLLLIFACTRKDHIVTILLTILAYI